MRDINSTIISLLGSGTLGVIIVGVLQYLGNRHEKLEDEYRSLYEEVKEELKNYKAEHEKVEGDLQGEVIELKQTVIEKDREIGELKGLLREAKRTISEYKNLIKGDETNAK